MDPADLVASEGTSPFAGGGLAVVAPPVAALAGTTEIASSLASPFAEAFDETGGAGAATGADLLLGELQDEAFDEALDALVDEVAARHLSAMPSWSAGASVPDLAATEAEAWVATVAARADRYLEQFEQQYADRGVDSLVEGEVDAASAQLASGGGPADATEQFLGGIVKKVFNTAKSAVKAGIKAAGSLLSIGKLFGLARKLVPWLLRRVLDKALNRLPKHLRGPAAQLAGKLGAAAGAPQSEGEALAAEFDNRLSRTVLAPNEAAADQVMAEAAEEAAAASSEPVAALDAARARLTTQLAEATPGQPPVVEIEQFVPAVMAVLPLVRTGIKIFGRDRFRGLVARGISALIKGHIGPQAAQALAPRIADVGMKLLSLEAEDPATLGAEALVSTVEDTIREVAALPDESLGEPLRLQTEIEEAFAAAAARHLPTRCSTRTPRPSRPTTRRARPRCGWRCPAPAARTTATASARGSTACRSDARRRGRSCCAARTRSRTACSTPAWAPGRSRPRCTCTRPCREPGSGTSRRSRPRSPARRRRARSGPTRSTSSRQRPRRCCSASRASGVPGGGPAAAGRSVRANGSSGSWSRGCACDDAGAGSWSASTPPPRARR